MTAQPLRIDERNHVEKPLLDQLAGLDWEIVDLDHKQRPADSFRESFAEVVMLPVLRERLEAINPWLEEDQVEEAVRRLTAGFPGTGRSSGGLRRLRVGLPFVASARSVGPPSWSPEDAGPRRQGRRPGCRRGSRARGRACVGG